MVSSSLGLLPWNLIAIFFSFSSYYFEVFHFVLALILLPDAVMCFHYATLGPVQLWQPVSHCRRQSVEDSSSWTGALKGFRAHAVNCSQREQRERDKEQAKETSSLTARQGWELRTKSGRITLRERRGYQRHLQYFIYIAAS